MSTMQDMMTGGKTAVNKLAPPATLAGETPMMRKKRLQKRGLNDPMTADGTTGLLDGTKPTGRAGNRGIDYLGG